MENNLKHSDLDCSIHSRFSFWAGGGGEVGGCRANTDRGAFQWPDTSCPFADEHFKHCALRLCAIEVLVLGSEVCVPATERRRARALVYENSGSWGKKKKKKYPSGLAPAARQGLGFERPPSPGSVNARKAQSHPAYSQVCPHSRNTRGLQPSLTVTVSFCAISNTCRLHFRAQSRIVSGWRGTVKSFQS